MYTMAYSSFRHVKAKDKHHYRNGTHRCQKTIDRLRHFKAMHEDLTHDEIELIRQQKHWIPSIAACDEMLKDGVSQMDRVEIVFVDYKMQHGTNAPSMQEIADTLGVSKNRVQSYVDALVEEERAIKGNRQFWLVDCGLTHPLVKRFLSQSQL